jgi:hypothetical protein
MLPSFRVFRRTSTAFVAAFLALALALPSHGAQAQAGPATQTAALPGAAAQKPDAPDPNAQAQEPDALDPDTQPPPAPRNNAGGEKLRLQLQQVIAERENASRFFPWLTFGVGYGATLFAAAYGATYALTCDSNCSAPNWISLVVVVGGLVGTLGSLWVLRANQHVEHIDSRRFQLEQELQQHERATLQRQRLSANGQPQFTLRFAL